MSAPPHESFAEGPWRGRIRADARGLLGKSGVDDLLARPGTTVRERPTSRVVRVEIDGRTVYVKWTKGKKDHDPDNRVLVNRLRWRLSPAQAIHVLNVARRLRRAGLDTAPVLLAAVRTRGWRREEVLVTEALDARSVYEHIGTAATAEERGRLFADAGRAIARLHRARFVHGDLPLGNLLRSDDGARWFFIDNDRTRRWWPAAPGRLRRRNLVQACYRSLGVFRWAEVRRLLEGYCAAAGLADRAGRRLRLAVVRQIRLRGRRRRATGRTDRIWRHDWR